MSEGLNSQIQKIKSMACGFRTTEHCKVAIYFLGLALLDFVKVPHSELASSSAASCAEG